MAQMFVLTQNYNNTKFLKKRIKTIVEIQDGKVNLPIDTMCCMQEEIFNSLHLGR